MSRPIRLASQSPLFLSRHESGILSSCELFKKQRQVFFLQCPCLTALEGRRMKAQPWPQCCLSLRPTCRTEKLRLAKALHIPERNILHLPWRDWSQRLLLFYKTNLLSSGWRSRLCWGDLDSLGVGRIEGWKKKKRRREMEVDVRWWAKSLWKYLRSEPVSLITEYFIYWCSTTILGLLL